MSEPTLPSIPDELREALRMLTPKGIYELAAYCEEASTLGEVAAQYDAEAARSERAAEGYSARSWHREAARERDRADELRRRAHAVRVIEGAALAGEAQP